jgi:hypothetical protein
MLWTVHGLKDADWLLDGMCSHAKHMLLLTERWTSKNSPPPNIPGHKCIHSPGRKGPTGSASGGRCIYVYDNIAHHVKQCTDHCTSERLWVNISGPIHTSVSATFPRKAPHPTYPLKRDQYGYPSPRWQRVWSVSTRGVTFSWVGNSMHAHQP